MNGDVTNVWPGPKADAWWASLPLALREALQAMAVARPLAAGQRLFARGDAPDGLYLVCRGAVRITGISHDGDEVLLALLEPPHWFGEIALFDHEPRTHDAWAETDALLMQIPQGPLMALLQAEPTHWPHLGRLLTRKLRELFRGLEETALLSATARVARRLAVMATGHGALAGQSHRVVQVSQEQLGLMLALTRQTVNQSLKALEAEGVIRRQRGGVEILDLTGLTRPDRR